jgi:Fe-S cluster assembly protein SufD
MNQLAPQTEATSVIGGEAERRLGRLAKDDWTAALRRAALARFRELGLPTRRSEAWKYTDPASRLDAPTRLAEPPGEPLSLPSLPHGAAVGLVNGFVLTLGNPPAGVTISRLLAAESRLLAGTFLADAVDWRDKPLAALNTALFADGVLVHVARGVTVEAPIEIVSVGCQEDEPVEFHPRCLVVVEEGGAATLLERHIGTGAYLSNGVVEVVLSERASLRHYKLQDESPAALHIAATGLALAGGASYEGCILQIGASLARCEVHAGLNGRGASLQLDGASLATGRQHLDNSTFVTHRAVGGRSRQMFRSVLDDLAHGVFQGCVLVERGAQKTDAYQLGQALLLSGRAEMDGKPALEIYADDVKCGHGASIGALDETALFYLRSRGLDESAARRLLIEGFLAEVVDRVSTRAVRDSFAAAVSDRLQGIRPKEGS